MVRGWDVVRRVLGLILLTAAGLKVYAVTAGTVDPGLPFASSTVQVTAAEVEALLGAWLLLGASPRLAWWATVTAFGLLAGASLYLIIDRRTSCGCFGNLTVSPWASFALDLAAVVCLARWRPESHGAAGSVPARAIGLAVSVVFGAAVLLLGGFALLTRFDRSPGAVIAAVRGEPLVIEPSLSEVGDLPLGESRDFRVNVRNHGTRMVRIIGGSSDCSCIATEGLPIDLPPRSSRMLTIRLKSKRPTGPFSRSFILRTDDSAQPEIAARVTAQLVEQPLK